VKGGDMPEYWICDTCGEKIENPKDGWVEWIVVGAGFRGGIKTGRDLRLVHHIPASPLGKPYGCQFNGPEERAKDGGIISDLSLEYFLGPDGLMRLLALISEDELPKEEVLEMIKRLHIPGYEIARHHFDRAIEAGVFEPNTPKDYYHMRDIEATIKFLEEEDR
jgi:hypothetical protein